MAVTKNTFLVGLLAFLCLSLSSAHRILKNNDAENEFLSENIPPGKEDQLPNFSQLELKNTLLKGNIPKFSSVGQTNGEFGYSNSGNNGNNGGGYSYPPTYGGGGGGGGCQSCSPYSSCPWQGCQGGCQGGCQVSPPSCGGCQVSPPSCGGCQVSPPSCGGGGGYDDSKVQHESIQVAEPDPKTVGSIPPVQSVNQNIKSSGGANQGMKSNGGMV